MNRLISYAQNFEDVILWRVLGHVQNGRYVDIGAQSPDIDSVSRLFYEQGWRGVHVEPVDQYASALRNRRPEERIVQAAISDQEGTIEFFEFQETGLSTTCPQVAALHAEKGFTAQKLSVPTITLDSLFDSLDFESVHWMKVDVEGAENLVISGWKASPIRPWVLVIESTKPLSQEQNFEEWEAKVLAKGYKFVYFDGLNRFYVSEAHLELCEKFGPGPNVFDNFAMDVESSYCVYIRNERHRVASEFEGQIDSVRQQATRALADLESKFDAKLSTLNALHTQEKAAQAHRWWLLHEEIKSQLTLMEASKSWRLTAPLRTVMRGLSNTRRRVATSFVRPILRRSIVLVFRIPFAHNVFKTALSHVPTFYAKLRRFSENEQAYAMARPTDVVSHAVVGYLPQAQRTQTPLFMDRRSRKILADIQNVIEGARNE